MNTSTTDSLNKLAVREFLRSASKDATSALMLKRIVNDCSEMVSQDTRGSVMLRSAFGECLNVVSKDVTGAVILRNMIIDCFSVASKDITNELTQIESAVNEYTVEKKNKILLNNCQSIEDKFIAPVNINTVRYGPVIEQTVVSKEFIRSATVNTKETKRECKDVVGKDITLASVVRNGVIPDIQINQKNTAIHCFNNYSENTPASDLVKNNVHTYNRMVPPQNTIAIKSVEKNAVAECPRPIDIVTPKPVKMKTKAVAECPIIRPRETTVPKTVNKKKAVGKCPNIRPIDTAVPESSKMKKVAAECPDIKSKVATVPESIKKRKSIAECPNIRSKEITVPEPVKKKLPLAECPNVKSKETAAREPVNKKKTGTECPNIRSKEFGAPEPVKKKEAVAECHNMTSNDTAVPEPVMTTVAECPNTASKDAVALVEVNFNILLVTGCPEIPLNVKIVSAPIEINLVSDDTCVLKVATIQQKYTAAPQPVIKEAVTECPNTTSNGTVAQNLKLRKCVQSDVIVVTSKDIKERHLIFNIHAATGCHDVPPQNKIMPVPLKINITSDYPCILVPNNTVLNDTVKKNAVTNLTNIDSQATVVPEIQIHTFNVIINVDKIVDKIEAVVGNDRKSRSKELARKRYSKRNMDNVQLASDDAKTDDTYLKLVKDVDKLECERRRKMLSWFENSHIKFTDEIAMSQLQQLLSKNAVGEQTTQPHSVQTDLTDENVKTLSICTNRTLIKRCKSLSNAVDETRKYSVSTRAISIHCVETFDSVIDKQKAPLVSSESSLVKLNNDSVKDYSKRSIFTEAASSENVNLSLLQQCSISIMSTMNAGSLSVAVIKHTGVVHKVSKECVTESGAKSERNDPHESYLFDEYSLHGVKGKKGPIYRGPPSSQMTKRKYLTSDNDKDQMSKISSTSSRKAPEAGKAKYSVCEAEGAHSQGTDDTFPSKSGNDEIGILPEFTGPGKNKYRNSKGEEKGGRAAKTRYINQCYVASVKAKEKAQKVNVLAESVSRK